MYYIEEINKNNPDGKYYGVRDTVDNSLDFVNIIDLRQVVQSIPVFGVGLDGKIQTMTKKKIYNFLIKNNLFPEWVKEVKYVHGNIILTEVYGSKVPENLVVPNCIEIVVKDVFANLPQVKSVAFGSDLTSLNSCSFYSCPNLEKVRFSKNLLKWGYVANDAFKGCDNIKTLEFPQEASSGFNLNFSQFPNITETPPLAEGVDLKYMSFGHTAIKQFVAPKGSKNLRGCMFSDCEELILADLSQMDASQTDLPSELFYNCPKLKLVKLSPYMNQFRVDCFYNCTSLRQIKTDNKKFKIDAFGVFTHDGHLEIPEDWEFHITEVSNSRWGRSSQSSFSGVHVKTLNLDTDELCGMEEVDVQTINLCNKDRDSVLSIFDNCFKGNTSIRQITGNIPTTVLVGDSAFESCSNFSDNDFISHITGFVSKPNSSWSQSEGCSQFIGTALTDIKINHYVEYIPENCFLNCHSLKEVEFEHKEYGYDLPKITYSAFMGTAVTFNNYPELAKNLRDYKLMKAKFTLIAQGQDIKTQGDDVILYGISKIQQTGVLSVPKGVTIIDVSNVMTGVNSSINKVELPETVREIRKLGLYRVESINLPDTLEMIESQVLTGMTNITFPSGMKTIKDYAFNRNHNLCQVIFNEGLEEIGRQAFSGTQLQAVWLPKSLKKIGNDCFKNCVNLRYVIFPIDLPVIPSGCCYGCKELEWVVVGKDTVIADKAIKKSCMIIRVDREELYRQPDDTEDIEFEED